MKTSTKKENKLFKYNRITGLWEYQRSIENEKDIDQWLEVFKKAEPKESFKVARNTPKSKPLFS